MTILAERHGTPGPLLPFTPELVAAVRVLLDPLGKGYVGDPSSVGLSRWLLRHAHSIALSPAGVDVARGLARAHRRAMGLIDNTAVDVVPPSAGRATA